MRQVSELPKFNAKATCMIALEFIAPRVDSPMESETRITTTQYGLPRAVTNYTVPGATFSNGAPITLDLAWPEFRVAIEYDGDHHRTDKAQWRRDNDKRELLRHHHWIVLIATAANMADEPSQAELAYRAGRQLALRGSIFDFTLTATPLNELARRKRRKSTGRTELQHRLRLRALAATHMPFIAPHLVAWPRPHGTVVCHTPCYVRRIRTSSALRTAILCGSRYTSRCPMSW